MSWSFVFLAVALVGALLTANAYRPRLHGRAAVPSFFAGWLVGELAPHHVAWQLAATAFLIWKGALASWPGWLALAITLLSWAALLRLVLVARGAGPISARALSEALGDAWTKRLPEAPSVIAPRGRLLLPFLLRDAGIEKLRDLRYADGAGSRHLLDVYRPRAGVRGAPILFQVHGGAWVIGDKRQQALPLMLHLAARGWLCVAANYRLAPKATFPDPIVDLKLALRWVREHAAELGGDPDFVAVTGGSAGGHLSALLALSANDPAFQPGFESFDTRVAACVAFYGAYDFCNRFGHDFRDGRRAFLERMLFKKRYADDPALFESASPLHRVHPDAPPFFVVHGTHDSLIPVAEARDFVRLLRECSRAPVAYAELPVAQHAFELFHSLRTRHVVDAVERFLRFVHAEHRARGGRTRAA